MKKSNIGQRPNLPIYFLLLISIFGCQKSELTEKQTLNSAELKSVLETNSSFNNLVTSGKTFVSDLSESKNTLSTEEVTKIVDINLRYPTLQDFNKNLTVEDKDFLARFVQNSTHGSEFKRFSEELTSRYIYDSNELKDFLLEKIVPESSSTSSGRVNGCGDGCCMHKAIAAYYNAIDAGVNADYAEVYMYGFYVGCMS